VVAELRRSRDEWLTKATQFAAIAEQYRHALETVEFLCPGDQSVIETVQEAIGELKDPRLALERSISTLVTILHGANAHWWRNPATDADVRDNPLIVPTKLMLAVSELSEAMEAHRKNLPDDKLTHRPGLEVEIADFLIRACDLAGAKNLPLAEAFSALLKLPREAIAIAMAIQQIAELVGALKLDVAGAVAEKNAFNAVRADHKAEARVAMHGKVY
jgi:hypothetical protein